MDTPDAQADRVTARLGEPVEVTVTGGFTVAQKYYQEELVHSGVGLGACFWYVPERTVNGGLCNGGEQALPNGLSMVDGTTFVKDFRTFVVKRGEYRKIEHTFSFTSNQPGEVIVEPRYLFSYGSGGNPRTEPGPENALRITFK